MDMDTGTDSIVVHSIPRDIHREQTLSNRIIGRIDRPHRRDIPPGIVIPIHGDGCCPVWLTICEARNEHRSRRVVMTDIRIRCQTRCIGKITAFKVDESVCQIR